MPSAEQDAVPTDGHPHGLFAWADLATPDPEAAKAFYAAVFGWEGEDRTDHDGRYVYTLLRKDGRLVAGLGPQTQAHREMRLRPVWNSHISVDSIDDVAAKVVRAGGRVSASMDVMEAGRGTFIQDPTGAFLGLWEPRSFRGADVFDVAGAMTWNELATRDTATARDFYAAILPWDIEPMPGPAESWVIRLGGQRNGGIIPMDDGWPAYVPAHWAVYFRVGDTDETVARVSAAGGTLTMDPFTTEQKRIAVIRDPQRAVFAIIASTQASRG